MASKALRDTIRRKIVLLAAASAGIALVLTCALYLTHGVHTVRSAKLKQVRSQAAILATQGATAVVHADMREAESLLAALSVEPSIRAAALFNPSGHLIGGYPTTNRANVQLGPMDEEGTSWSNASTLVISQPILLNNRRVGDLRMKVDFAEVDAEIARITQMAVLVGIVALSAAVAMASFLQNTITRPIRKLAAIAHQVSEHHDYRVRAEGEADGELGELYVAFNDMLAKIEAAQSELEESNDLLEQRVAERTSELWEEIEERRRTQNELVRARDDSEAANRAKSRFLANMSHEIRTPLNAILGFADLLRRGGNDPQCDRDEMLATIQSSGKHLLELINDILDLSKIESGRLELDQRIESPHQIISEVLSLMRVPYQEKGLSLEYHWTTAVPERIQTDAARLRQVLTNLLGNAMKFTQNGGVEVIVRLEAGIDPRLAIEVVDTGIGIPPEKHEQIFDPFVQADTSVTRKYGGTGLGLAISRRLARAMGGDLKVESYAGRGSTFVLTIETGPLDGVPLLKAPASGDLVIRPNSDPLEPTRGLEGMKVLVVDDGSTNRKLISLILRRAGAVAEEAENGQEAFEMALAATYDVILMDMQMPVLDGYSATQKLREHGVNTPIYALTAHAMKGDKEKCLAAGCSGYLTKPIDGALLLDTLRKSPSSARAVQEHATHQFELLHSALPCDDEEFREIVVEFIERFAGQLALFRDAVRRKDVTQVVGVAHWLRGAGGTAGFPVLTAPATELGRVARSEDWEAAERIVDELHAIHARIQTPLSPASVG